MNKINKDEIGKRFRHPDNRFGQGSPDFWKAEYKLYNVSRLEYWTLYKRQAPKCPICGTQQGMSFGTGDCGCGGYNVYI